MKNLSAVIPTLLKDIELLNRLIQNLTNDESVKEIIIINNSGKQYNYNSNKVKILFDGTNHFVNPSWNIGVKEAKSEYVALINDDIIIPNKLCTAVLNQMNEKSGIIGMDGNYIINLRGENNKIKDIPQTTPILSENIILKPVSYRTKDFGIIMFFKKDIYKPIPEDLKIFFGDDYIIDFAKKQKKICAVISKQEVIHCGSLSSNAFREFGGNENKNFKKHVFPWYKRIINFYQRDNQYAFFFMFLNISIKKKLK